MRTLNAIDHIRSLPAMYLPRWDGDANRLGEWLAQRSAGDALILGAHAVETRHVGDCWAVSADVDWLAVPGETLEDLFDNVVAFPEAGVNSMRSEVLLAAFADTVTTTTPSGTTVIKPGDGGPLDVQSLVPGTWARTVAFRVIPAHAPVLDRRPAATVSRA
jgi:hypothetical protein